MEICCQSYNNNNKNNDTICQCHCSQQLIAANLRSLRWQSKQAVLTCSPWNAMLTYIKDDVNDKTKIGRMIIMIYIKAGMPLPIPASWVYWHEGEEAYWPPRPALLASAHIANLVFYCLWYKQHIQQGWTGKLFFSRGGAGRGEARQKIYGAGRGIIIIISTITSIIAIIINSTKDDILDMEELFHMLTNFREQSLMPC